MRVSGCKETFRFLRSHSPCVDSLWRLHKSRCKSRVDKCCRACRTVPVSRIVHMDCSPLESSPAERGRICWLALRAQLQKGF